MTFEEILQAIRETELTAAQEQQLRQALDEKDKNALYDSLTPEERSQKLLEAAEKFREGLTDEELQELVDAMNDGERFPDPTGDRVQEAE
jgi:Ca2+-binding EF-hand superfamily protein